MASSSSSLPLSSTDHQNHYIHEVFLSFRGEDTRFNFTDHLHTALCQRGIKTFRDDGLRRGEEISSALVKAIKGSRVSIIVFSQNYASSRWCLDELVEILECRKSKGQEVRAVFYKVGPSDVRHQRGAFGEAFYALDQCKYKDSMDKWKAALKEAADLSGWPFKDGEYESKFINDIVGELSARVINPSCELQVAAHPIGIESCRQDVNRLLHTEEEEDIVRMVGIWGPGGIGKTTIAKDVFNSIRHEFEDEFGGSCFVANVRSKSSDLAQLQETLLFHILRDKELKVRSVDEGVSFIKTRMQQQKVLLILDDVNHSSQLQNLVPSHDCFGPGSRILITTRDKRWLIAHQVDEVYEVKMLNDRQALNLFSLNAFKRNGPPGDYQKLAQRAVRYAQGLPLALIVLGSHLFRRSREEWEATLDSCRGEDPHREIRDVLKISYDALGVDLKGYFLDIACFFKGKHVEHVKPILEACYDLKSVTGIAQLQEKALIRIDRDRIWMHDLIEEMGKDIVSQESPGEPGKRSRVWSEEDVSHVLTNNTGTSKVTGIQVLQQSSTISLNAKNFSEMKNLRYISMGKYLKYESFSGDIDYLSNQLRWLDWPTSPLLSFPSDFHANKLVKLNIPDSRIITRLWKGRKNFSRLTYMNLRGCESLTELPNFSGIPNLKELDLANCKNLTTIPCSIYELQNLEILNVSRCSNLVTYPTKASISHDHDSGSLVLPKLRVLKIKGCNLSTADFIGSLDCLETLTELDLSRNNFVSVPALGKFFNLARIELHRCKRLREIPELPPNILEVDARDCESLERYLILPKFLNMLEMNLWNCHRFSYSMCYDMMENILLNNQNNSPFTLVLPGSEVPKWFHISKEVAANEKGLALTYAISFEIPIKLNWENIGLALCSVLVEETFSIFIDDRAVISINGELIDQSSNRHSPTPIGHMRLNYVPLSDEIKGKVDQNGWSHYHCRVQFYPVDHMKSCGVHLVCQPPNEYSNKIVMAAEPADESGILECLSSPSIEDDCESLDTDVGLDI
ncbi:putative TIR domain, winged helix-turn-helix DNA-binding domain-containing protein [Rosa chinensis]|uniref:Putative TIR domain, winged helix-turn-helix DNA-binding domain-containing protein n=1 Tax=Rosa chinensis TaxID=74649 RepID=A0A2P6QPC5_ROSCH|nr:disease resistance protein RUN1 [Rosa chinensis]XP_024194348.1 disease resistance protein RUN1 [Rosa chinensis]XP_040374919.1 disease resistance protein RUN1 [Rosa chinensis]XP_040374920.1 disease resistance protein RUN1 [Rosa chinensis]XP_040374921.1 disease resistance protein RUN1 [Rosa chinensis]XP_040374922.1 disease resistance protein RUN1 [Rosa chinensis]XP_040374923.1 disease resistance protein RUN1 [Rosa chinensis]XP_040374924.1 disease resistance protein RUN1 [Rosa chinensis]XP_